jgi:hypothetical protein
MCHILPKLAYRGEGNFLPTAARREKEFYRQLESGPPCPTFEPPLHVNRRIGHAKNAGDIRPFSVIRPIAVIRIPFKGHRMAGWQFAANDLERASSGRDTGVQEMTLLGSRGVAHLAHEPAVVSPAGQ